MCLCIYWMCSLYHHNSLLKQKTSLFMFAMISEWGRSFNNLFIMLFKRSRMYFFTFFAGWSTVWWRKIENSVREKNLISFFHFTCHNIPRITTVSCWVLTLWKLLFCTCNILCFRCTNWVCFWIVSLQCYPPCLRLWLTRGLLHIYGHSTFPRGSGRSLWTCDT